MKILTLLAAMAFAILSGCSSEPVSGGGGVAGDMIGAVREFRGAIHAVVGEVTVHRKRVLDAKQAKQEAEAIRQQTGLAPSVVEEQGNGGAGDAAAEAGQVALLRALEMEVREDEMIAPDGSLHPSAAQALARMDGMVVEHGGDFAVYVPSNHRRSVEQIKTAAPHAAIIEISDAQSYRLVVTPERS